MKNFKSSEVYKNGLNRMIEEINKQMKAKGYTREYVATEMDISIDEVDFIIDEPMGATLEDISHLMITIGLIETI